MDGSMKLKAVRPTAYPHQRIVNSDIGLFDTYKQKEKEKEKENEKPLVCVLSKCWGSKVRNRRQKFRFEGAKTCDNTQKLTFDPQKRSG